MKFLFLHQNLPGQFLHLLQALKGSPRAECRAITDARNSRPEIVKTDRYLFEPKVARASLASILPTHIERGRAVAAKMRGLKQDGFVPDIVIGHFGWGETLFVKDVFPHTRLILHAEFFYRARGADIGFDPEFPPSEDPAVVACARNAPILCAFAEADAAVAPTRWQASLFPKIFAKKIALVHEGVDTRVASPNSQARFLSPEHGLDLGLGDEVITFVSRNLEPYRGYHILMRALPAILRARPHARIVIVGGEDVSYGARPTGRMSWKEVFLSEVRDRLPLDRLHFVGKIPYPHLLSLFQLSAVHIYLTYPFVLSWSMLDAMSCGALVVASDTAPVREVIEDGRNGLLVDFFDIERLADRVVDAVAHQGKLAAVRRAARATIVDQFEVQDCVRKWLALIQLVAQGRSPPGL